MTASVGRGNDLDTINVIARVVEIHLARPSDCPILPRIYMSNEKKRGCLGYIRDYTTQFYGNYFKKTIIRIPVNKPVTCFWKQRVEAPGEKDTKHNILLNDFDIYICITRWAPTRYKKL